MANKTYKRNVYSLKIKLKGIVENQVCINKGLVNKYGEGGRGGEGLQNVRGGGGYVKFYPYEKGGGWKRF